jgi:NAD(P)-dependent dehydrogenase (short-subunit alcohol dehydrogenase family)
VVRAAVHARVRAEQGRQLTKTLALALAPYGIRVNGYGPGVVETAQANALLALADDPEAKRRSILDNYLVDDLGRPEEIARVVCFLASPLSRFVNGVVWPVDGGFTAWKATRAELPEPL